MNKVQGFNNSTIIFTLICKFVLCSIWKHAECIQFQTWKLYFRFQLKQTKLTDTVKYKVGYSKEEKPVYGVLKTVPGKWPMVTLIMYILIIQSTFFAKIVTS